MEKYFEQIEKNVKKLYKIAEKARSKNLDPEPKPSVVLAKDMAERVEGLISTVAPQLKGKGVSKRIRQLEKEYGFLDWRISLIIADEVAKEKFCKFEDKITAMEIGIRTGFAYHTLGTVASPLEGFVKLKIKKRKDGKEYFSSFYSGPIRSAGGTGASVSVIITDYVRKKNGYSPYDPTPDEIKRYSTELYDYHERITNLQYLPSVEEIEFLAKHIPIQISGDPSEKREVSNYKDLPRVETNKIRNGVCLTMGEGVAQKAPKLWKQLSKWGKGFDLENWNFLEEFVELQKRIKAKTQVTDKENTAKIMPNYTFIKDLVAGRPVLAYPLAPGGFRLRYGRSRTSGYSSSSLHPATLIVLDDYIATGTQLKTERPGKATTITPCESIEGPIVKLKSGEVLLLNSEKQAKIQKNNIDKILFLGDILINYGDFLTRAHPLIPAGYCPEWWVQELEKNTVNLFGSLDTEKLSELTNIDSTQIDEILKNPLFAKLTAKAAISFTESLKIPLHPDYTYHWNLINTKELLKLLEWLEKSNLEQADGEISKITLPFEQEEYKNTKLFLEKIGLPHLNSPENKIIIEKNHAKAFTFSLGFSKQQDIQQTIELITQNQNCSPLEILNKIPSTILRDKSGIFIGARMGRPEKAKIRKLKGQPHVLFPVGKEGGRFKSFQSSLEQKNIRAKFPLYYCKKCNKEEIFPTCTTCGNKTIQKYFCKICGTMEKEECLKHGTNTPFKIQDFNINEYFKTCLTKLKTKTYPDLIKGIEITSNKSHLPENLIKGILRAKHKIYVNKDGTIRYDMSQLPITHFKPIEVGTTIEKLKELGYTKDIKGKELIDINQTLELKPQDIILPKNKDAPEPGAHKCFFQTSKFIDELLVKFYNLKPYYNLNSPKDLVGHLITILAPHTSAGIVGRIVGFSDTQGLFASPMIHAATRRDCDGDEACAILLLDNFLNFSRKFLPAHRGATQDSPLIITSKLIPSEIDDMVFDLDVVWKYPLELYNATLEFKNPWEVKIKTLKERLNTPTQYFDFGFTHPTKNMNSGVTCSAYKTLPSMKEKLSGQMDLAEKIMAADEKDVARIVIEKHFIKDIKGNLRRFSTQKFRCVKCNEKYRRPPISGKCDKCRGKIIFTVSEGFILKYLEPTLSLSKKYDLSPYLNQSILLTKKMIESIFGRDNEKQEDLGKWFG